ncbi:lysylphosphatidylglycerol synthase transmembrane domain-containing protein [Rhizobium halophytocola]|uniref:Uncharacterized membrane protein YbhN (UPF0104 family) n=1 Tax=Rhizobium halophytocola TaxID=735519 RepID=A0ABS4DUW1_9HYPH|nr:uncharacterized membrane protein YbhN (UPF0104 family) [Rhizobium halophytocola]
MPKLGILAIVICLALFAGLFVVVDPAKVIAAFGDVSAGSVVVALLIVQVQIVLSALRWQFTAARLGHRISRSLAVREYYVSSVLNQVLPGGMAGDAVRAYRNRTEEPGGWKRPATAVFLERLSGQLAFFLMTGLGLIAWPVFLADRLPEGFAGLALTFLALLVCGLGVGIFVWRSKLSARFERLKPDLVAAFWRDGAGWVQVLLSASIVAGYVSTFLIASHAVGAPLPPIGAFTAVPLCLLTMLIPAGIGGWGTREVAAAALWPLFGFTSAQGVSASLLYGSLSLAGAALPGLVVIAHQVLTGRIGRA